MSAGALRIQCQSIVTDQYSTTYTLTPSSEFSSLTFLGGSISISVFHKDAKKYNERDLPRFEIGEFYELSAVGPLSALREAQDAQDVEDLRKQQEHDERIRAVSVQPVSP